MKNTPTAPVTSPKSAFQVTAVKNIALRLTILGAASVTALLLTHCGSHPIVPDAKNVTVTRDRIAKDCREIGPVQGSVASVHGTIEQAIDDMKLDASRKGANYVQMGSTSAYGTSASGTAYFCP